MPISRNKQDWYEGYHQFHVEETQEPLRLSIRDGRAQLHGSLEVFWHDGNVISDTAPGWYWQDCFPGCLPEGVASGPYGSSRQALGDANEKSRARFGVLRYDNFTRGPRVPQLAPRP